MSEQYSQQPIIKKIIRLFSDHGGDLHVADVDSLYSLRSVLTRTSNN